MSSDQESQFANVDQYRFIDEKKQVYPVLQKGKELHESVLDFGLFVVSYCNDNSKNLLSDTPIMMLLREILEVHDAISILSENMAVRPAQVNLRAQLELYLQLKFIFDENTHERAKAYHVDSVLKKIETYQLLLTMQELTQDEADTRINNLESMLNNSEYALIRDSIRAMRAQPRQQYAPWYRAYNEQATNLKQLARIVNRDDTYGLYGPLSKYAHGYQAMEGVQVDPTGSPVIRLLRLPIDYPNLLDMAARLSIDSFRHVYSYYCQEWEKDFVPWYNYWCSEVEQFSLRYPKIKYE